LTIIKVWIKIVNMKLDIEKIKRLKKSRNLTYQDIADMMGFKSRQHVYEYIRYARITGAEKFAKVFGLDPKDLIK